MSHYYYYYYFLKDLRCPVVLFQSFFSFEVSRDFFYPFLQVNAYQSSRHIHSLIAAFLIKN